MLSMPSQQQTTFWPDCEAVLAIYRLKIIEIQPLLLSTDVFAAVVILSSCIPDHDIIHFIKFARIVPNICIHFFVKIFKRFSQFVFLIRNFHLLFISELFLLILSIDS